MSNSENQDFFSKLWKCPIRRSWRYGRKFLVIVMLGFAIWLGLDVFALAIMEPVVYPPFQSLVIHAFATILVSLILTLITHQLYLRYSSRFRLIRLFQFARREKHD